MATFLTREGIVQHLYKVIEEAEEELVLISPFIKADDETKNLLKKTTRGTSIHVIFGKSRSARNLDNVLSSFDLPDISVSYLKDLHAKCYLNEKEAIITSMNLHEFSQEHNDEMGILVSKQDDPDLYSKIYEEANRLKEASNEPYAKSRSKSKLKVAEATSATYSTEKKPKKGFCIRCKATMAADPQEPYCPACLKTWRRYSDPDYEDNYCHICGEEHATSMRKPLCPSCYAKHKDDFQFTTR